jgi:hypothetical protein
MPDNVDSLFDPGQLSDAAEPFLIPPSNVRCIKQVEFWFREDPEIRIQKGAKILGIGVLRGSLYLWASVDPSAPICTRYLWMAGVGETLPDDAGEFVCSVMTPDESKVWFVFDMGEWLGGEMA